MNVTTALRTLNIKPKFPMTKETISIAYRKKAKENHPDITGDDTMMKLINESKDYLDNNIDDINYKNLQQQKVNESQETMDKVTQEFVMGYMREKDIKAKRQNVKAYLMTMESLQQEKKLMEFRNIFNRR